MDGADDVCVWPPSHDLRLFTLDGLGVVVVDACDPAPQVAIGDVRSSDPDDDIGDGSTSVDYARGNAALCVRSERSGPVEQGRTYDVSVTISDHTCNSAAATVHVHVPHDLGATSCPPGGRPGGEVVADGAPECLASVPVDACTPPAADSAAAPVRPTEPARAAAGKVGGCSSGGGAGVLAVLAALALAARKGRG